MNTVSIDKLTDKISQLRHKVIEIKGISVFNEVDNSLRQPKERRLKDVKVLENQ